MSEVCYDNVDPIVLYDIFYESGTRLIGHYASKAMDAISRNDEEDKNRWLEEINRVIVERGNVGAHDREGQIAHMNKWNAMCDD